MIYTLLNEAGKVTREECLKFMVSVLLLLSAIFALSGNMAQASTLNHAGFPNPLTVHHRDSLVLRSEQTQQVNARAEVATQQDADGDGLPDITTLSTSFHTSSDQVIVVDGAQNMEWSDDVNLATDFTDDVWIFDVGADGTAQLIVKFAIEGPKHTALVYDDFNGDGQVSYRIEGDQVTIDETQFWHVKVETDQGWAEPWNGATGKVTFLIDGYDGLGYGASGPLGNRGAGRDGIVDWQVEVDDKNADGINDYQLKRATSPSLVEYRSAALHKAVINVQTTDRRPAPYDDAGVWPLLIGKHRWEDYRYFDHFPAIAVDWEAGAIDQIGVLGFPIEAGYHIFSRLPLEKHTVNSADFENPMAYYDMANDADGWPELQVRFDLKVPSGPIAGQVNAPIAEVNYSWDQDNDNRWDYKINLASNNLIDEVVDFPDFAVKSVPYDEIIPWVRTRVWDVAMLVFDSRPSPDSEGMYGKGWMIDRGYADGEKVEPSGVSSSYLMGLDDHLPTETYQDIQEGMRGEYNFQYFDKPKMYLSALDRQLHLSGAEKGVWNLGEGHYLRYANLDGDAYLDQWQEESDGMVVQQLNYGNGVYVVSGKDGVQVKQTDVGPAMFETQPPKNYEEWQRLDEQLKAHQTAASPEDFTGMLAQLSGPGMQISEATVRDYRITSQGFRFMLELQSGFSATPDQENLGMVHE